MWVWVGDRRIVNLKKATQIRRTRRGYRVDFNHPSLSVRVSEDDGRAFSQVRQFVEQNAATVSLEADRDRQEAT